MQNVNLPCKNSIFLVGVALDQNLKWHTHSIISIVESAAKKLCFLFRGCKGFSPVNLLSLYKGYSLRQIVLIKRTAIRLISAPHPTNSLPALAHRCLVGDLLEPIF